MLNLPSTSTTVYFEVEYKVTDADGNDLLGRLIHLEARSLWQILPLVL